MGSYFYKKTGSYLQKKILLYTQRLTNTCKTISRRFYHKILLTLWKCKIIGLCEYVLVSKMRNVTRAKMPNFGVAIWRTILNIKTFMLPKVCAWITVITFTKIYWILPMHSNVTIKNLSWPHFSWPTLYVALYTHFSVECFSCHLLCIIHTTASFCSRHISHMTFVPCVSLVRSHMNAVNLTVDNDDCC